MTPKKIYHCDICGNDLIFELDLDDKKTSARISPVRDAFAEFGKYFVDTLMNTVVFHDTKDKKNDGKNTYVCMECVRRIQKDHLIPEYHKVIDRIVDFAGFKRRQL